MHTLTEIQQKEVTMKTIPQLIKELREMPLGNLYLEKGLLMKELCQRFGMDFYTVKTADFEKKCDDAMTSVSDAPAAPKPFAPGDLFVCSSGATMRRNEFFQIIAVKGSRVFLCAPETALESDGWDSGREWISSRCKGAHGKLSYAKIVRGRLKLCHDDSFKVKDHYWDYLKPTEIGKKESFYGD